MAQLQPETAPSPKPQPPAQPQLAPVAAKHAWRFRRIGGLDQVSLDTPEDLRALDQLDPKLWVALSCPTRGLDLDPRTLELLDADGDGRVRVPEILAALRWCTPRLKDLAALLSASPALALDALDDETPEGIATADGARRLLAAQGKEGAAQLAITDADAAAIAKVFEKTRFNGDGVVTPDSSDDPATRDAIADAIACLGGLLDRSGAQGVDQAKVDAFFAELRAHAAWWDTGAATPGVMALGAATPAAWTAFAAVRAKIDDWFVRSRLAALDPRAGVPGRTDAEYAALAAKDLSSSGDAATFPLARVVPGGALPLLEAVNPAFAAPLAEFQRAVVQPLIGQDARELTLDAWTRVVAALAPCAAWQAAKQGAAVERLGAERVKALLGGTAKADVDALLARDLARAPEAQGVSDAIRLAHYQRDLHRLLRNFVSFVDLYDLRRRAVFQAGTLYLDGRSCDLCVRVEDPAAHATLAASSRMYIAYCECRRAGASMRIAACITQGDSDYLVVGRNGLFVDAANQDWDATVVRILDNPISVRQAFWAPYKKLVRFIEEQATRFAGARAKASEEQLESAATTAGDVVVGKRAPPAPVDIGRTVGIIAALGVGVGALGTLLGGFVSGFLSLQPWWAKPIAVLAVPLIISGPSMLVAWLKLRQRTLGPVLDATGWAVNGRVKVNAALGGQLTACAELPQGATRTLLDPYEDVGARRRRRLAWLAVAAIAVAAAAARWFHVWPFRR